MTSFKIYLRFILLCEHWWNSRQPGQNPGALKEEHVQLLWRALSIIRAIRENGFVQNLRELDVREQPGAPWSFTSPHPSEMGAVGWKPEGSFILHRTSYCLSQHGIYTSLLQVYIEKEIFKEFRAVFSLQSSHQNNMKEELPLAATHLTEMLNCNLLQNL